MKRSWIVAFLVLLAAAFTLQAGTRVIPIAGHLPGANGTSWATDVSLTNNDNVARSVDLVFHPDDRAAVVRTVTLPANGSLLLADAVRPDSFQGANPTSWGGQLEVRSDGNVSASAHTYTSATAGGTYGSAYESFDPSVLPNEGAMSGLIQSRRYRSNVAYANATGDLAIVTYAVRDESGALLATDQLAVPAHSTVQIALARDVASTTDDARRLVEWISTTPLYALASVVDNLSNDPTNIPSVNGATELFFPVVGRTPGAQSTFWSTSAAVSSRADVAGTVTFAYRDNTTGQLVTTTADLPARGTVRAEDVNTFVGAGNGSGALTITATVPVVSAVRVFNTLTDGSTYGSALLAQDNAVRGSLVRIQGVRRDDAYRLNVALSGHSGAADGTVRLFDDNGQEVEVEPFHVEAEAMTQISLSRGAAQVHSGEVEVETHNGVSVTAVASSVDNRTGDTSVHEAEQENERHHELEIRITPRTAAIGAQVGFSIGDAAGITSVQWTFGDGTTGSGATTTHAYASAGEFAVTAVVTLASGAIVRDQEDVHVVANGGGGTSTGPIDFTWSPVAPAAGQEVTFTATGTTAGGSFKWKFPGNVRKTGSVATFTFPSTGSFEVELELEHDGNGGGEVTHVVSVGGTPSTGTPSAIDFTWSPANPAAGEPVTFTATGGNGGVFRFEFPGGVRKSGSVVTFTFAGAGSFEVELEQEHQGSTTLHARHTVNVGGGSPNGGGGGAVDFAWSPASPAAGQEVTFTATGGNGGVFRFQFPGGVRKTGSVVTFTFASAGSFEVELEQEKEGSTTLHATHVINVGGGTNTGGGTAVTSVDFSWSPSSPRAGAPVTFTATSDVPPPSGASFKWRLPDDSRPRGTTATFTFAAPGTYKVRVEIEQPGRPSIERERNVVVAP
ncbi:MAG: PKD domain-containing protein [Acidobacteria bacterium]|nr:PKD domain-containing protein [Acidobacteriota bacterium]MBV9476793.1 PKD domain-containing protein [Acidobacteriota bacterium]